MIKAKSFCLAALLALGAAAAFGASITVTAPVAGERWRLGSTVSIYWSAVDVSGDVVISLVNSRGRIVGPISNSAPAVAGFLHWEVGRLLEGRAGAGDGYCIRVRARGTEIKGDSGPFSIVSEAEEEPIPLDVRIRSIPSGSPRYLGARAHVYWMFSSPPDVQRVNVELYKDGIGPANLVGTMFANHPVHRMPLEGEIEWTVGEYIGGMAGEGRDCYRVKFYTTDGRHVGVSPPFSMLQKPLVMVPPPLVSLKPSLTVYAPLAPLVVSHLFHIPFRVTGTNDAMRLDLVRDSGEVCVIADGLRPGAGGDGRYLWKVGQAAGFPDTVRDHFRFRLSGGGVTAESDPFAIVVPSFVAIEPGAGERVALGSTRTIRWNAPDVEGNLRIEAWYREGGGAPRFYQCIVDSTLNMGHKEWRVWPAGGMDPPPTGHGVRWFLRFVSKRVDWLKWDGPEFVLE